MYKEKELTDQVKIEYLAEAREVAKRLYRHYKRPISVDDVRYICPPPKEIDARIMGAVFNRSEWQTAGWTRAKGHCNARPIRTFVRKTQ